jgi:hypothetical protein
MRTAAVLGLCTILTACGLGGPGPAVTPVAGATSAPIQAASAARIVQPTGTLPTPPGPAPAFACADGGGGVAGSANVTSVRVTEQNGFDRFVIQFDPNSKVPAYTVKRQAKPVFKAGASGQTITLTGTTGVLVLVRSATEAGTYTGPTDITHPEFQILNEARLTQDFEGTLSWGLGLSHAICLRTFTAPDPPRLIVDFIASSR